MNNRRAIEKAKELVQDVAPSIGRRTPPGMSKPVAAQIQLKVEKAFVLLREAAEAFAVADERREARREASL